MNKKRKYGGILPASLLVLMLHVFIIPGTACAQQPFIAPTPIIFEYPVYVSIEQVTSDYKLDSKWADAKYKDRRLVFNNVEVEEIHSIYYQSGGAIAVPMVDYFRAGLVRFELLDARGVQQRIQSGFILNLDGTCQGMVGSLVRITDCWVGSVKGDLGIGLPAVGQY